MHDNIPATAQQSTWFHKKQKTKKNLTKCQIIDIYHPFWVQIPHSYILFILIVQHNEWIIIWVTNIRLITRIHVVLFRRAKDHLVCFSDVCTVGSYPRILFIAWFTVVIRIINLRGNIGVGFHFVTMSGPNYWQCCEPFLRRRLESGSVRHRMMRAVCIWKVDDRNDVWIGNTFSVFSSSCANFEGGCWYPCLLLKASSHDLQ